MIFTPFILDHSLSTYTILIGLSENNVTFPVPLNKSGYLYRQLNKNSLSNYPGSSSLKRLESSIFQAIGSWTIASEYRALAI